MSDLKRIIKEEVKSFLNEEGLTHEEIANKYKHDRDDEYIAFNESYWQWEYDTDTNYAFLYLDRKNGDLLRLVIVKEHIKSGIGKGTTYQLKVDDEVGTLYKPLLAKIRSLLKQNSHQRTRAGYPFPKLWQDPARNLEKADLASILKEYQNV